MISAAGEWFDKNLGKFSKRHLAVKACAKAIGRSESQCRRILLEVERGSKSPTPKIPRSNFKAKTLSDFRNSHDVERKIKLVLEALPDDGYVSEQEIKDAAQIDNNKFARFRDRFQNNFLVVRDHGRHTTYWAKPHMIKKMKEIVDL